MFGTEKNPKPPSFSKARVIEKDFSGNKLKFLAPPHRDPFSKIKSWEKEPNYFDIFNPEIFHSLKVRRKTGKQKNFDFRKTLIAYSSIWEFRGIPILQGYCGDLILIIDINTVEDLPVNESLFDNRILAKEAYREFELVKLQDLHRGQSDDPLDLTAYHWPSYIGPINSQWLSLAGHDWLYFEDQPLLRNEQTINWIIAIDDKRYLSFRFSFTRSASNAGNPYRIEQRVPRDNFLALMHKIMDSLTLGLNPKAAARRAQVQAQPGASDKPILTCTPEQVEEAKHVLYMWSGRGYEEPGKSRDDDHRANPEDVAAFIEERIKPRPLPNSYPPGELLKLEQQPT
ncbi:hypothetical protein [Microbulbifer thermotolerans]|uniref:hypothetical protein n=1 Tax=Microbulbifer thermotolerans TaxID=252514 RepID=UPI00224A8069|nr:hypothetical protein [Microbulbifer thermotolerans]MCX2778210.1 hypothetical protein [Microbulbifer thermotolerans]MCX2804558.1 hypothetical protein [Microbulbifer thermotolerans]